jgi:hypothetical protein
MLSSGGSVELHNHHVYLWNRRRHHLKISEEMFRNLRWYPSRNSV